jgi:hypothetical protein
MIIHVGDAASIFDSDMQTLVCPVNTVATMGAGLAKMFDLNFPGLLMAYKKACWHGIMNRQGMFLYVISERRKVLCFPTKHNWRNPSRLEWIDTGLGTLAQRYEKMGITSLAVPALGCGLGDLHWRDVLPLIEEHLGPLPIPVEVFDP